MKTTRTISLSKTTLASLAAGLFLLPALPSAAQDTTASQAALSNADARRVYYRTTRVDGLKIFYREAGSPDKPTLLLLHGFPSSSHMFRDLIPLLSDRFHLVAPDYPGFGQSDMPATDKFAYTFDHLADVVDRFTRTLKLDKYSLYVQDYGAPIGFRLATHHPERVQAIITQNGNAYEEGLTTFWGAFRNAYWKNRNAETEKPLRAFLTPQGTAIQYYTGVRDRAHISPDALQADNARLSRPGNQAIQLALFYDYRTNPALYPAWHAYLRSHQPPVLAVWGKNDPIFAPEGATAFQRDVKDAEVHLLDTGHFALEEDSDVIARYIADFLGRHLGAVSRQ